MSEEDFDDDFFEDDNFFDDENELEREIEREIEREREDHFDDDHDDHAPLLSLSSSSSSIDEIIEEEKELTGFEEIKEMFLIAIGVFVTRASWVVIKTTDFALLGHVNKEALAVAAISDLYTSAIGVFLVGNVLSIFVGNAIGSGNLIVAGEWLQISLCFIGALTIPVMLLWFLTENVLLFFNIDPQIASKAGYYATVLAFNLPAKSIFGQLSQFLTAQRIVYPSSVAGIITCILNLILGLILVLGIPIPNFSGYGFYLCPIVTLIVGNIQLIFFFSTFFLHFKLHKQSWEGWIDSRIIRDFPRYVEFAKIYFPAALSLASDYWRVTVIGAIAAKIGETEVAVFSTSYRILWMTLTVCGSLASAVSVRLAIAIGAGNIETSKRVIKLGAVIVFAFLILAASSVYLFLDKIVLVFSSDEEVINTFIESGVGLCLMLFFMNLAVFLERIPTTFGRTRYVLYASLIGSWVGQVPSVLFFFYFYSRSLSSIYYGASAGYCLMCFLLLGIIYHTKWEEVIQEAKERSQNKGKTILQDEEEGGEERETEMKEMKGEDDLYEE